MVGWDFEADVASKSNINLSRWIDQVNSPGVAELGQFRAIDQAIWSQLIDQPAEPGCEDAGQSLRARLPVRQRFHNNGIFPVDALRPRMERHRDSESI